MVSPLFEQLSLLIAGLLALLAPLSIPLAYKRYTPEQRAQADGLYHFYLFEVAIVSVVGTASFMWVLTEGLPTIWMFPLLLTLTLPGSLILWKLHKEMGYTGWFGTA